MAVLSAMHAAPISRLKCSWEVCGICAHTRTHTHMLHTRTHVHLTFCTYSLTFFFLSQHVPARRLQELDLLNKALSPKNNYKSYRMTQAEMAPPYVPFLGLKTILRIFGCAVSVGVWGYSVCLCLLSLLLLILFAFVCACVCVCVCVCAHDKSRVCGCEGLLYFCFVCFVVVVVVVVVCCCCLLLLLLFVVVVFVWFFFLFVLSVCVYVRMMKVMFVLGVFLTDFTFIDESNSNLV